MNVKGMIKSNKGFSLVELMVVVAIIGILAAIAVPNVNRYMLKSRQGEAKTNLASIYTAERAFFTEHTTYVTDIAAIGFSPEGQVRYNVGFTSNSRDCATAGVTTAACPGIYALMVGHAVGGTTGTAICDGTGDSCSVYPAAAIPNIPAGYDGAAVAQNIFTSGAIAPFGAYGGTSSDVWQINQNKVISNTSSGL